MAYRENQGDDFGNLPFPGLTGNDLNGNIFAEVVRGITGPDTFGEVEAKFKSDFSLSSNTGESGGVFFEGNRRDYINSFLFGPHTVDEPWPYMGIGLTGTFANPDVDGSIGAWAYYARGFTGGGITGSTTDDDLATVGYSAGEDSIKFVDIMDLPTIPYGPYGSDDPTNPRGDGRTSNKVLTIDTTGETFSANFRSSNTNVLFSINHDCSSGNGIGGNLLTVASYRRDNKREDLPSNEADVVDSSLGRDSIRRMNNGQRADSPRFNKYDRTDQVYLNGNTDLMFIFHANDADFNAPSGNVLKLNFPVPVRGTCLQIIDSGVLHANADADVGGQTFRTIVEGDHVDGSTFTYIMLNRTIGGAQEDGSFISSFASCNKADAVSYLALNERTDKHIKNLYVSVIKTPVGISYGNATHLDHGLTDMIGPARYFCNGGAFDGSVVAGTSGGLTLSDAGKQNTTSDTIAVKLSVMPAYTQGHWQKEKRGGPSSWVTSIYNEWRKITRTQKGKTFGITGSRNEAGTVFDFGGFGVTFGASAATGTTLGITMGYRKFGDEFNNYETDDAVEAFQYEVIKGTTVDGAFIPVWKKTRTI